VRAYGSDTKHQIALSGAFFFDAEPYRPPAPVPATIHARIVDADSGKALAGRLTEMTYSGPVAREGRRHDLATGEGTINVPGTVRIRAEAAGYSPLTLSPIYDNPELTETITQMSDQELLSWDTFEKIRWQLGKIELTFRMKK